MGASQNFNIFRQIQFNAISFQGSLCKELNWILVFGKEKDMGYMSRNIQGIEYCQSKSTSKC
jgi:hypothetical protein